MTATGMPSAQGCWKKYETTGALVENRLPTRHRISTQVTTEVSGGSQPRGTPPAKSTRSGVSQARDRPKSRSPSVHSRDHEAHHSPMLARSIARSTCTRKRAVRAAVTRSKP